MVNKEYDIVVYGATGFTGQLICEYLNNHRDTDSLNWAISGRSIDKLTTLSKKYSIDLIQADAFDLKSLDQLTSKTKLQQYSNLLIVIVLKKGIS